MKQLRIHFFILWFIALNRCNPYLREHINPSLLPPLLLPFFGDAMVFEMNAVDRRKLVGIHVRELLFYRLLGNGNIRISPMYFRYLMRRKYNQVISLPLSDVYLPKDYERKFFEAVAIAPERTMFLSAYHHFVEGMTCLPKNELVDVSHYTLHQNGRFEAIITGSGSICMGRLDCPIQIKMEVIRSEATFCVFHPFEQMLIVGRKRCIVEFYRFSCDLQSATPSFVMTLVAKHTNDSQSVGDVTRITVNSLGNLFAIEYKYSMANLVYMDSEGNLVANRFIDEPLKRQIGGVTAVSFFTMDSKIMIFTTHITKYCVWTFDKIDGSLTMVSQIDAIKGQYVVQIISHLSRKFIMRTSGLILVIQLDDDLKGCRVLMKQPTNKPFSFERDEDYKNDSMALFDEKLLIVVVPTQNIVLFFLVKETEMVLMFKKSIDKPLCWTFNRLTGTFSSYYKPVRMLYKHEFEV
jgi:hypothetical protein